MFYSFTCKLQAKTFPSFFQVSPVYIFAELWCSSNHQKLQKVSTFEHIPNQFYCVLTSLDAKLVQHILEYSLCVCSTGQARFLWQPQSFLVSSTSIFSQNLSCKGLTDVHSIKKTFLLQNSLDLDIFSLKVMSSISFSQCTVQI